MCSKASIFVSGFTLVDFSVWNFDSISESERWFSHVTFSSIVFSLFSNPFSAPSIYARNPSASKCLISPYVTEAVDIWEYPFRLKLPRDWAFERIRVPETSLPVSIVLHRQSWLRCWGRRKMEPEIQWDWKMKSHTKHKHIGKTQGVWRVFFSGKDQIRRWDE